MKKVSVLVAIVLLAACASDPIVDMRGVDPEDYRQDLAECRDYAAQVRTGGESVKGGAVGAAVGGAIGAAIGDSDTAQRGAGVGAVSGVTRGAAAAERRKERVLYTCLRQRGYKVLG